MILRTQFFSYQIDLRSLAITMGLVVLVLLSLYFSLAYGKKFLSPFEVFEAILEQGRAFNQLLVNKLRMPRTLLAGIAGALLALSGYLMQVATKNPLASPSLTSVNDSASFGAVLFLVILGDAGDQLDIPLFFLPLFAISFAFLSLTAVMTLSQRIKGGAMTLILVGVAVSLLFKAGTSLLMVIGPIYRASQAAMWLSGDVSGASMQQVLYVAAGLILALITIIVSGRVIQVMCLASNTVNSVGGHDSKYRFVLIVISGLMASLAVAFAGPIGFIGVIIPNLVKRFVGGALGVLTCLQIACLGASFVLIADTLGRTLLAPIQIPVGITTAVVGGVGFLIIFYQHKAR